MPSDRYVSAQALANDIEHWLADEPIVARADSPAERLARWGRKHRSLVRTGVAALLVVAAVSAAALVVVDQARRTTATALSAEAAQRQVAEARETQAIDAVKRFRDAVANEPELKNSPKLKGLRKRLLKEPLAFFKALRERLQADSDTRPESLARLARASNDLARLIDEIGDKQDALIAYRECLAIFQKLCDAKPTVSKYQNDLAAGHNNIGIVLGATGKPAEALAAYESALAIQQKLADANPSVTEYQSALVHSLNNIGNLLCDTGKLAKAAEVLESALAIQQKLADANPTITKFQTDLAASYNNIGNLLHVIGKAAESLKAYESALAIRQKLADANPNVTEYQSNLAQSQNNIGILLENTGKPHEALKAYQRALAILEKLADGNLTVTDYQRDLAATHASTGVLMMGARKPVEAQKAYKSALAIQQRLADADPSVTEYQRALARSHNNMGLLLSATGKPAEAMQAYESALAIERKLAQQHPESPHFGRDLGATLNNMAIIDLRAKRYQEARVRLRSAVEWQRKAMASNLANPTYQHFLAKHLSDLMVAARALGDAECVAEAERELARLRDSDPAFAALDARLAAIVEGTQQPQDEAEQIALAQRAYDKALFTTAARLWVEELEANPALGDSRQAQHRYNAACCAALAGSGQGGDVPPADDAAKAKLRQQVRDWLKAELAAWSNFLATADAPQRTFIAQTLAHWQQDSDLAGIRDTDTLAKLPDDEREALAGFWTDVAELRERAETPRTEKVEP